MSIIGVIPARYDSKRFPGKCIVPLLGKPLIQWVIERVLQSEKISEIVVAVDDERVAEVVLEHNLDNDVKIVETSKDHKSGTDRIAEALKIIEWNGIGVVNIQGDEPLVDPDLIDQIALALYHNEDLRQDGVGVDMFTACVPFSGIDELNSPDCVKIALACDNEALYFSRSIIPFSRSGEEEKILNMYRKHVGIYGYTFEFLKDFVKEPECSLEKIEKLEQLRALWMGARIKVLEILDGSMGVDTPEDLKIVEEILRKLK